MFIEEDEEDEGTNAFNGTLFSSLKTVAPKSSAPL